MYRLIKRMSKLKPRLPASLDCGAPVSTPLIARPAALAFGCLVFPSRAERDQAGGGFHWRDKAKEIELGLSRDAAGCGFKNPDGLKIRLVFAFVGRRASDARGTRRGNIGPCPKQRK